MNSEYVKIMPKWALQNEPHDLVLSNDIDSLASCALLKKIKGWDIKYFYDFNNVYKVYKYTEEKEKCWVDVAIKEGHAFDNHVSNIDLFDWFNDDMVNLNHVCWITNENYSDKYAGSTLLQIWSLYDIPLPVTEEGMMLLLAIDTSFKGFYSDKFHDVQKHYLVDILGFEELYNVIKRHKADEFYDVIGKYGLSADIVCKNAHLNTRLRLDEIGRLLGLELELPEDMFTIIEELDIIEARVLPGCDTIETLCPAAKTLALTYKNKVRYSIGRR